MKDARIYPAQAFAHPLWLGALLLLILNDHVLKGSGWMPGAITGKLSDFAGLVVAPAVLSVLLRARTRRSVLACACAIFAVFTLIKLSQASADLLALALSKIWVDAKIYADPSDLLALPMLWLGVRLQEDARPLHTLWRLTAFSVGLWACLATE